MDFRPSGESSYVSMDDPSIFALRRIKDATTLLIEREKRSVRSHSQDSISTVTTGAYPSTGSNRVRNQPDVGARRLMDVDKCDSFTDIGFESRLPRLGQDFHCRCKEGNARSARVVNNGEPLDCEVLRTLLGGRGVRERRNAQCTDT